METSPVGRDGESPPSTPSPLRHDPLVRPHDRPPVTRWLLDWLRWFGIARALATVAAVVLVAAGGLWLLRTPPTPVESGLPMASSTSAPSATSPTASTATPPSGSSASPVATEPVSTAPATIVVHVAGAVAQPGIYTLAAGSRVVDAVAVAGGVVADADLDAVNLAGPIGDGTRVYIPRIGGEVPVVVTPSGGGGAGTGAAVSPSPTPSAPIDINAASVAELDALPGVGPSTAAAIVEYRSSVGPFASVEDLLHVRGIGAAKLDAIRDLVRT
ncbi:MAG TPA: helix-hairpin-helix domain-containing protein [Ilumatobacteraceae bacterium]|nr:helix-hairpin-helix domain-containing protein [Ilumatobacteraceae bacterium]